MGTQRVATDLGVTYTTQSSSSESTASNSSENTMTSSRTSEGSGSIENTLAINIMNIIGRPTSDTLKSLQFNTMTLEQAYPVGGGALGEEIPQIGEDPGGYPSQARILYWYHPDYIQNVDLVTDLDGEAYELFLYNPWGEQLHHWSSNSSSWTSPYRFNAKEVDPETGLAYYGARYYQNKIGVWLSVDPLAEKYPDISPYAFVANNPIFYVDPDGREIITHRETADDGTVTVVVTVTGKLVNESGTAYTAEQLQGYADRLAGSIADSYTGTGETVNFRGVANISVASDDNPLSETDHAFRIVDQGSIPGAEGKSGVLGRAPFGENVVYLSEHMLDRKEAAEGNNAGTGKTDTGLGTLERTGPHELGHSGNLKHPTPGTMDGNLMHQTKQHNAGNKVTEGQILQIEKDYQAGNLNKGKQKL